MDIMWIIIVGNLCLSAYLIGKIWNLKQVTIKETIKETKEVEVEKIVYRFPELMATNKEILAKMPDATVAEKDVKIIIQSLMENPDKWSFSLGWLGGDTLYGETVNHSGQKFKFNVAGMKNGKADRVTLIEPADVTFDPKWNPVFHNLTWDKFHALWTKQVQDKIEKQNKLSSAINDLMDKSQKRDNNLDELI